CGLAKFCKRRVLLIDLDAQGHCQASLSSLMPAEGVVRAAMSVTDVLLGEDHRELLDSRVSVRLEGLDMTPADGGLAEAEGRISQKIGKEMLLRDALKITRTHYDYIIIDCPPNKGNLTLNALMASEHVVIPCDLSPLSMQGADELIETALTINTRLNHQLSVLGVLFTRVDARNISVNDAIRDAAKQAWGDAIFATEIGVSTHISKAQLGGEVLFDFAPSSRGAKHYEALTKELLARLDAPS